MCKGVSFRFFLAAAIVSAFLWSQSTKQWQSANQEAIKEFKKDFGEGMTLFPKNHTLVGRIIALGIVGSFLYLLIALLIFFFA